MKKYLAMLLAAVMVLSALAGCGSKGGDTDTTTKAAETTTKAADKADDAGDDTPAADPMADLPAEIAPGVQITATPDMYPNVDLSKEETVYIYLIGDTPNDFDQIVELANEYLAPFNTKIEFTIWAWSDYSKLYSMNLAAGENIDLIFTAPWCYLWTEAPKGSFLALSDEFIADNMPLTKKYQIPSSWDGVKLAGQIIAVPQNTTNPNGKIVAIRQDLADKYNIGELTSWDDYKQYCLTIAEKETPDSGILAMAAAGNNSELWDVYKQQFGSMTAVTNQTYLSYYYTYNGGIPSADDLTFAWETEWFKNFCLDMKEMADAGCWSRNALSNEVSDDDAFGSLAGASIAWNTSVFTYIDMAEKTEGVECAAYSITEDKFATGEAYNNNDMAITSSSEHPERAAMVLDLIKNDTYLNHLFRLGIEGTHYEIDAQGNYTELEKSSDYAADNLSMCWAIKNGDIAQSGADERKQAIIDAEKEIMVATPTEGFVFDDSAVQSEAQAADAVFKEYIPSLQLGLYDDPEAKIAEMMTAARAVGLDTVLEEIIRQYTEWAAAMN